MTAELLSGHGYARSNRLPGQDIPGCKLTSRLASVVRAAMVVSQELRGRSMTACETGKSGRLDINVGDGYTSIEIKPKRTARIIGSGLFSAIFLACIIFMIPEIYSEIPHVVISWGAIFYSALNLFFVIVFIIELYFLLVNIFSVNQIIVAKSVLTYRKKNALFRKEYVFDVDCIEQLSIVPDKKTVPVPGRPYDVANYHVEFVNAGEPVSLLQGLMKAEAKTITNAIRGQIGLTGETDTVGAKEVRAPAKLYSSGEVDEQFTADDTARPELVQVRSQNGITFLSIKPAIDISRIGLLFLPIIFVSLYLTGDRLYIDDFKYWTSQYAAILFCSLISITFAILLLDVISELMRREYLFSARDDTEYLVKKFVPIVNKRFDNRLVEDIRIVSDKDETIWESDFKNMPVFHVSFDYGETTYDIGRRLRYADARMLRIYLTREIHGIRNAA